MRLWKHIHTAAYGCENMAMGDIDGDGRVEFVFIQGPGSLGSDWYRPGTATGWRAGHTTEADQALDCITAVTLEGRILWQKGEPWRQAIPFRTHGCAHSILIADLDGDGAAELLRLHGRNLELIEGRTGRLLRSVALDSDHFGQLLAANFAGDRTRQMLVKPLGDGAPGHPHGCPVFALDHRLRPFWPPRDYPGVGHVPLPKDVDGDGRDELFLGWSLLNPDGTVRWTLDLETGVDKCHPDRRIICDVDGDGELEQVVAMEDMGLVVSDLRGRIKFRRPSGHCGEACVGKYFGDRPGLQILYNDEVAGQKRLPGSSILLDGRTGKTIWSYEQDLYGVTLPRANTLGPDSILATRHEYYDDPEDARPFVMDGRRNVLETFDIPRRLPSYRDVPLPHTHLWRGDWGDYYTHRILPIETGGAPHLIIWSRTDVWIFNVTEATKDWSSDSR